VKMKKLCHVIVIALLISVTGQAQTNKSCKIVNTSFLAGEQTSYIISYNWFVIFSEVGTVSMNITSEKLFGFDTYHLSAEGKSYSWWDSFFKVRDKYETWVRQDNLRPLFFQRNTHEGDFRQHESYSFKGDSVILRKSKVNEKGVRFDTMKIGPCTYDIMSSLLYARNFDFSNPKVGQKFPVAVALDNEVYDLYFRYQGLENVKIKELGTFECMKFSVMLVEGTMFHEGENMVLWVTNDKNHIPVYIESPILIGNIKARLVQIKGNRYPLTSKK
jgi:hypothetical protein